MCVVPGCCAWCLEVPLLSKWLSLDPLSHSNICGTYPPWQPPFVSPPKGAWWFHSLTKTVEPLDTDGSGRNRHFYRNRGYAVVPRLLPLRLFLCLFYSVYTQGPFWKGYFSGKFVYTQGLFVLRFDT